MKRALAADIRVDVGKTDQYWVSHAIAGHDRYVCLVG